MHSSEGPPGQPTRATGVDLLLQLGRLIIRSRSGSPQPDCHTPSTSEIKTQPQPKSDDEVDPILKEQLTSHVSALWTEHIPVCIEVLLAPDCVECHKGLARVDSDSAFDKQHLHHRGLLLERWTMHTLLNKSHDSPMFMNPQWLVNAVRSQLHFSQLSAWRARMQTREEPPPLRRKLSREQCNYKKIEANCEPNETNERKLHVVYSIKIPGESYNMSEFSKQPTDHVFPITEIGNNVFLKLVLQSLPRLDDIPTVKCSCQKRRPSKDMSKSIHDDLININDDLVGRLNDLSIGSKNYDGAIEVTPHRLSIINNKDEGKVVDDRMLTPCSENGKHKCSCDDESDSKEKNAPKKLDERRLKEIAKYKRRLRKEKMRKLCESTSSEGENLKTKETTSIPILQASRFDRFRAIGCYRNQTYLTLPATRIETKSPFTDNETIPPPEFKKTNTIGTQTDFTCSCGSILEIKCEECNRGMVRSDGNYNLAGISELNKQENGARRKLDDGDEDKTLKKPKCDNFSVNCDSVVNNDLIKRPKFKRFFPIVDRLEKIVNDRNDTDTNDTKNDAKDSDIKDLHLNTDDSVFSVPKDSKRQKTYSIGDEDYVLYEKCDYGTIDKHDTLDSPKDLTTDFKFAMPENSNPYDNEQNLECFKNDFVFNAPKKNYTYDSDQKNDSMKSDNLGKDRNLQSLKHVYYPNRSDTYTRDLKPDTYSRDQNIKCDKNDKDRKVECQSDKYQNKYDTYAGGHNQYDTNTRGQNIKCDKSDRDLNLECQSDKYQNKYDTYTRDHNQYDTVRDQNLRRDKNDRDQNIDYQSDKYHNLCNTYVTDQNKKRDNYDKYHNLSDTYDSDQNTECQSDKYQNLCNTYVTDNNKKRDTYDKYHNLSDTYDSDQNTECQSDKDQNIECSKMNDCKKDGQVPSSSEMDRFRWTFDSAASMVFHTKTGLPLTSSPAPLRRGNNCFDFDDSINGISGIKSALFHPISPVAGAPLSPVSPPRPKRAGRLKLGPSSGLLGSFEESALQGRLEAVATVAGFTAELGASGAFCPPHRRLPVTVFFYAPGGTNAPYMGHINLGAHGYRVSRSGTIQVSLFNPHGTLVKMFVVLYDLTRMPPLARTFLRQRTLYMPAGAQSPQPHHMHKWLRYLIHLRFMTSKSGKLYLHTDIRLIVSRKADLDTATAHSALFRPLQDKSDLAQEKDRVAQEKNQVAHEKNQVAQEKGQVAQEKDQIAQNSQNRSPNRVFGGCSDQDTEFFENQTGVPYELRSFTYAPENPRFSPR